MKRLAALTGLTAMLLAVVACATDEVPGRPAANETSVPSNAPSSRSANISLPYADPCSLLSARDLRQLKTLSPPSRDDLGTSHGCTINTFDATINIGVRINVGLAGFQANGGRLTSITIGDHQAKQDEEITAACTVAVGVSPSSRVDVTASADAAADACPVARQVAQLIEPKLPAAG